MYDMRRPGGMSPVQKIMMVLVILLTLSIIPIVMFVRLRQAQSSIPQDTVQSMPISQGQTNDENIAVSGYSTTLYVPEETASTLTGNFVIEPRPSNLYSFASAPEWSRPIVVDIQYKNREGVPFPGITFPSPITVCFTLTPDQWNQFTQSPGNFQVQYYDDGKNPVQWVALPAVQNPAKQELCGQTGHLSVYALAMRAMDVVPVTGATVTSTPTAIPNTVPTSIYYPPTRAPRDPTEIPPTPVPPTQPPPTSVPPTIAPTEPPPTTQPTDPPVITEPPPATTDPASTDPPGQSKPTKPPKPTKSTG